MDEHLTDLKTISYHQNNLSCQGIARRATPEAQPAGRRYRWRRGGQASALEPRFKSSTYLSMRVENLSASGGSRQLAGRVKTRHRFDLKPKSLF
jgi:hypothetical protein